MAAINVSRPAARLLLGGFTVLVIVVAVLMWPQATGDAPSSSAAQPPVTVTSVPGLPAGAAACDTLYAEVTTPFNAGARGTPMTSCGFVEQVRRAYPTRTLTAAGTSQLRVTSPSTQKSYDLVCFEVDRYATCTGGQGAVIYLYNQ